MSVEPARSPTAEERAAALVAGLVRALGRVAARPDWPLLSALALGLAALAEASADAEHSESGAILLNLLATVPLALRRTHLTAVAAVVTVASLFLLVETSLPRTVAGVAGLLWVLYLVAARYRRRVSVALGLLFAVTTLGGDSAGFANGLQLVLILTSLALGDAHKVQDELIAERDAAQRDQAAMGERARIARELHDVVAHHVSMIAVQAETARLTTADLTDEGKQRFEAIGATARDALAEMRRLLGVLRADAGGVAERAPQPGLGGLEELIEAARAAGTEVRLTLDGEVVALPPGVDLTAYRIVQEALTNARQHAPGADVEVALSYGPDALRLRACDSGPGPAEDARDGHGLLGMRERVAMVGGTLDTGAADGGGFFVEADLPLGETVS